MQSHDFFIIIFEGHTNNFVYMFACMYAFFFAAVGQAQVNKEHCQDESGEMSSLLQNKKSREVVDQMIEKAV